ncbi:MAG: MFS transporter [Clostridia bacterium]|nr:MFS transporter [Clostridia bacterium]
MNGDKRRSKGTSDYKWVIILLCFFMVFISLGFASYTKSLFPDEIAKDLGTERSLVSLGESFRYISTAVINIFFGAFIAKFGAKKMICAGFVALVLATFLYGIADSLAVIYIGGTLLGIGFSWTGTAMVGHVVGLWCKKNRGTVMGFILASNGIGGAIAVRIVGSLIDPNVVGSYRRAYFFISALIAAMGIVLLIFFKDKKKSDDTDEYYDKQIDESLWQGIEISVAVRKFYFWGAVVCVFFSGLILQGTFGIVAMHMKDVGIDYSKVTTLLTFGSLILAGAKFLTGFLYDKCGLRVTASICTLIATVSCFTLASVTNTKTGFILAIIYTVISQFAMPLETVMLPIYAEHFFGERSYTQVLGIFVSVNTAGFAVGAPILNLCYDIFGSYRYALIAVGSIFICVFILLQIVISCANKERLK